MAPEFKDYFSRQSAAYASTRPLYPEKLFEFLASLVPSGKLAWDCATGNGQAAVSLAYYFDNVIAIDASSQQIEKAFLHPKIRYRVAMAEDSGIPHASVDLVTVASGIHWFNIPEFYREVNRVLKTGGVLAVWTYTGFSITPQVDEIMKDLYFRILLDFWPPESRMVWNRYKDLDFPFEEIECHAMEHISLQSFQGLISSLESLSAVQNYIDQNGHHPVEEISACLSEAWGNIDEEKPVRWDICMRAGRKGNG